MGDGKHGTVLRDAAQGLQHMLLGFRVQIGCDLIQQQKLRIRGSRPGDGQKLPLALGEELRCAGGIVALRRREMASVRSVSFAAF